MSIDGGSINSSIRIELDKLTADVKKVETIYDNLDKNVKTTLKKTEAEIQNVTAVTLQGGIKQEAAIKKIIALREKQIAAIQANAIKNKGATESELTEIKKLEASIDTLNASQKDYTTTTEKSTKVTDKQTSSFNKMAAQAALVALAIVAIKKSISIYADTEQQLANVQAVTNATAEEFTLLKEAAEDAGETTRFTASDAADALYSLSSAGLDATQSVAALNGVLLLAGATGSDLDFTAKTLTATISQFNLESEDAAKISNIFAAAAANSQATMEKLSAGFIKAGPIAGQFGLSVEETTANLEALFNAGLTGESSGTAIRNILLTLSDAGSNVSKAFIEAGGSLEDIDPRVVGLTGAMEALAVSGVDLSSVFEKETVAAALTLGKAAISAEDNLRDLETQITGTEEASRQYAVQNDTLAGSMDKFASATQGVSNSFLEELTPIIRIFVDLGSVLLNLVNKLPDVLKGIGAGAVTAAVGFLALSKALAVIGVTMSTGPLGLVALIGGVAIGLTSLVKKSQAIKQEKLADEFGAIAEELGYAGAAVDEFVKKAGDVEDILEVLSYSKTMEESAQAIKEMSESLGLSEQEIIAIGLASKDVSSEYKTQLQAIKDQVTEQQIQNDLLMSQELVALRIASGELSQVEILRERAKIAAEEATTKAELEAKEARILALAQERETLNKLFEAGLITESELLQGKIDLRQEEVDRLIELSKTEGEVSQSTIDGIKNQQYWIDQYQGDLDEIIKTKTEDVKKEKADAKALAEAKIAFQNSVNDNYNKAFETKLETLEREYKAEIETAEKLGVDTTKITAVYEKEKTDITEEETEKRNALEAQAAKDNENIIDNLKNNWESYTGLVVNLVSAMVEANSNLISAQADAEIAEIDRVLEAKSTAIDEAAAAEIEALGLTEETTLESLERQRLAAEEEGDLETAQEYQDEYDRTKILEDAEDAKTLLEEEAELRSAKIQYNADMTAWESSKATAVASAALAIIQGYAQLGPIGGSIAAFTTALATGFQLTTLESAKPVQSFATGGIVLPEIGKSTTGDQHQVNVNPGELILNAAQQSNLVNNDSGSGSDPIIKIYLDGQELSDSVGFYFRNGKTRYN